MRRLLSASIAAALIALTASSCGKGDESIAKKTGSKVGAALSELASAVNKDEPLNVELSEAATAKGLKKTIVKRAPAENGSAHGVTAYIISTKAVSGQLLAKVFDKSGQEIGRASVDLDLGADDARYYTFRFSPDMDFLNAEKFLIDIRK